MQPSVLKEISSIFHFILVGDPFAVEKVSLLEQSGGDQLVEADGIFSIFEVVKLEGVLDSIHLSFVNEMGRRLEIDGLDLQVQHLLQEARFEIEKKEKDDKEEGSVIGVGQDLPEVGQAHLL